jgi:hypothetical protein
MRQSRELTSAAKRDNGEIVNRLLDTGVCVDGDGRQILYPDSSGVVVVKTPVMEAL